jgi:hypothetical protein
VEKAGVAIMAAKRLDSQFGQEGLEKTSSFRSTGAHALARRAAERHDELLLCK